MGPQAYQRLINRMTAYTGADLESFFDSYGLGGAYRWEGKGGGKLQHINHALAVARVEGSYESVLADAWQRYGGTLPSGEPPWPPQRIRVECDHLASDLEGWRPHRDLNDAQEYIERLNVLLAHLRARDVATPDDFALPAGDRATSDSQEMIGTTPHEDEYEGVRRRVALVANLIPSATAVVAQPDERLSRLRRAIQDEGIHLPFQAVANPRPVRASKGCDASVRADLSVVSDASRSSRIVCIV